jgi:prophage regulatory protein
MAVRATFALPVAMHCWRRLPLNGLDIRACFDVTIGLTIRSRESALPTRAAFCRKERTPVGPSEARLGFFFEAKQTAFANMELFEMKVKRLPEVIDQVRLCRSQLYLMIGRGLFPAPVRIGRRAVAWLASEIDDWIAARVAERERQRPPQDQTSKMQKTRGKKRQPPEQHDHAK